jgi:enoyl-CoA hydratase/carnithine racemase
MYETILMEKKDRVATVTLNRPDKMNSITPQMQKELIQALDELEADDDIAVVILTGAGRAFSAGFDVSVMTSSPHLISFDDIPRLVAFNKPIIAAVNGYALAQGFQISVACDFIVASEKAVFGGIGARINELCSYCVFALPRVVGRSKAAELLFTAEHISGEEAYKIGLATKVVPAEQLMEAAQELAGRMKDNAPLSLKYTKQALRKGEYTVEHVDWVKEIVMKLMDTEDHKEAFAAIIEKRKPVFKGR